MGRIRIGPARHPRPGEPRACRRAPARARLRRLRDRLRVGLLDGLPVGRAARRGSRGSTTSPCPSTRRSSAGSGHLEASGRKWSSALGALDRSAGIAAASGAEVVVFHPGFLLGRSREDAIDAVVEQLALVRERLEGKGRAVPFGIEVMGRVRDLGSLDDCVEISRRAGWVRPVIDFAHMHATSDGAFVEPEPFREALELVDARARAGRAVPHPFLGHRLRQPQRDQASSLRRGHAPRRPAPRGAGRLRPTYDGDLRVAGRDVEPGDPRRAQMIRAAPSGSRSSARRSST